MSKEADKVAIESYHNGYSDGVEQERRRILDFMKREKYLSKKRLIKFIKEARD